MNSLQFSNSLYLKQHATNPVDWQVWGENALERAKKEDKPIFLSIGYSSCHWCHVMAHECFEDPEVANLLNQNWISIKVDREERPDLDMIYQNVAQILTKSGGWPLTVFLTPDLKPFFGGTYFPKEDRYGRPGLIRVLQALAETYRNNKMEITSNARQLTEWMESLEKNTVVESEEKKTVEKTTPSFEECQNIAKSLLGYVDWQFGGIGGAPKFPGTPMLAFLWRMAKQPGISDALKDNCLSAVVLTLKQMALGGIYDSIAGGFHRYSVDEKWRVPHFEKMLYDNAHLMKLYAEILITDRKSPVPVLDAATRSLFTDTIHETAQYLFREMEAPSGGFFSAQDADSEGEEGKFFSWTEEEIRMVLNDDEYTLFKEIFELTEHGNLYRKDIPQSAFEKLQLDPSMGRTLYSQIRQKLYALRSVRIPPATDEKVIISWNAYMISGLVWGSKALLDSGEVELAQKMIQKAFESLQQIFQKAMDEKGFLKSLIYSQDDLVQASGEGFLDDYASVAMACLDMARVVSVGERAYLMATTKSLVRKVLKHFYDATDPGYFYTPETEKSLLLRPKSLFDAMSPSGTSQILSLLIALQESGLEPEETHHWSTEAYTQLQKLWPAAHKSPYGHGEYFCALLLALKGPVWIECQELSDYCWSPYLFPKKETTAGQVEQACYQKKCVPLASGKTKETDLQKIIYLENPRARL